MTAPTVDHDTPIDDAALAAAFEADPGPLAVALGDGGAPAGVDDPDTDAPPEADQPEDVAPADPDSTAPPTPDAAADPLPVVDQWMELAKGATPLGYKQDGAAKVFDGILEVPGKGAIIPADKLEDVRNMVARYESNAAATKTLYAEHQTFERLGGQSKFYELQEQNAQLNAASLTILDAVTQNVTDYVTVVDGQIVPDTAKIGWLVKNAGLATKEALWNARQERETAVQAETQQAGESEVRQHAVPNAIDSLAAQYGLTPEDVAAAKAVFVPVADALLFKATPEHQQKYGYAPGTLLVDREKMRPWLEERQALRARQAEDAKARAKAAKENAVRVPVKPAPKPRPPVIPRDADGKFAERKRRSPDEYFEAALGGKPTPGTTDDE